MVWQICIRYPNGQEKALCAYKNRETALKQIDAIYSQGYPMHVAYVVRPIESVNSQEDGDSCLRCA
jgi:hypothetical protein